MFFRQSCLQRCTPLYKEFPEQLYHQGKANSYGAKPPEGEGYLEPPYQLPPKVNDWIEKEIEDKMKEMRYTKG